MAPVAEVLSAESNGNATVGAMGKTKSGKPLRVRSYPKFDSLEEERQYRKQHLAAAYRVFAERGMLSVLYTASCNYFLAFRRTTS